MVLSERCRGGARRSTTTPWERRPLRARLGELRSRRSGARWRLPRPVKVALFYELVIAMVVVLVTTGAGGLGIPQIGLAPLAADQQDDDGQNNRGGRENETEDEEQDDANDDQGGGDQGGDDEGEQQDGAEQDGEQDDGNNAGQGDDGGGGEFEGRDDIGRASPDEYVPINQVQSNSGLGEGGDFSGGSYSIECSLADHKNPDNPIIAPGVRNGAQHVHDYAGNESTNANSDSETLGQATTTCTNGDQSPFFWPVLRDLNGVGPDVGQDGGSLDGNVGSYINPSTIDITFHGHGSREIEPMPRNLIMSVGAAKAATADGEGSNAKFSCSGFEDRVTDQYPICPRGSSMQRIYDFPSCWDGENLDSEDHTSHLVFPDKSGECAEDEVPVPALRLTVGYDDMPSGRSFAIDSFPEQQHDPITDHALTEFITSQRRAEAGAACINAGRRCQQGEESAARGSTLVEDQQPLPLNFGRAFSTHANAHGLGSTPHHGHR